MGKDLMVPQLAKRQLTVVAMSAEVLHVGMSSALSVAVRQSYLHAVKSLSKTPQSFAQVRFLPRGAACSMGVYPAEVNAPGEAEA